MIRDATTVGENTIEGYDVCIIGAGAAGITLALELAGRGMRVCLLEAGGDRYSGAAQRLLEGTVEGDAYPPLSRARLSALGGSTQVWAGWCRPLDPIDFEARSALAKAGWPFGPEELLPYYRRAQKICGLAEFEYDADTWRLRFGAQPLPADPDSLVHCIFQIRVLQFGTAYRRLLEQASTLDVLLRASVTGLELDAAGTVRGATVQLPGGRRLSVSARDYVLAAGGIENARLLLLSGPAPERAPGNANDLVGRFFSDHPFVNPGWLVLHGEPEWPSFYLSQAVAAGSDAAVRAGFALPRQVLEREELFGATLLLQPRYEAHRAFDAPEVRAFRELMSQLRSRALPESRGPLLARAARGPHRVAVAALRKLLVREGPVQRRRFRMMFETAFRPENRVELSPARDALGRPHARVRWQLERAELARMRRTLTLFDAAFRRSGIGHIEPSIPDDDEAWRCALEGGKHSMGTTRMHADPAQGVVDADCRVHGTQNLHVAGSSVFPSGGYANPTLTIVALAVRLADHIARPHRGAPARRPPDSREPHHPEPSRPGVDGRFH